MIETERADTAVAFGRLLPPSGSLSLGLGVSHDALELRPQVLAAIESAGRDLLETGADLREIETPVDQQEVPGIEPILFAMRSCREHLHRKEILRRRDGYLTSFVDDYGMRRLHHLGFNSTVGCDQIDDDAETVPKAHRRDTPARLAFHESADLETRDAQVSDESFDLLVALDGDREIDMRGKAGLRAERHGDAADEGESNLPTPELAGHFGQRR